MCCLRAADPGEAELPGTHREPADTGLVSAAAVPGALAPVHRCSHCPGGRCSCVTCTPLVGYTYGSEVGIYCGGDKAAAVYLGSGWYCLACGDAVRVVY